MPPQDQPGLFSFLYAIFGFPMGLVLILSTGTDLYTSSAMLSFMGKAEGELHDQLFLLRRLQPPPRCTSFAVGMRWPAAPTPWPSTTTHATATLPKQAFLASGHWCRHLGGFTALCA